MGRGTTAIAAKKLKRQYVGIEVSSEFCKMAEERLGAVSSNRLRTNFLCGEIFGEGSCGFQEEHAED